jgi:NAD(P)-dependent dehydrogenase (short-subunit alcohol dehydrogenase family)
MIHSGVSKTVLPAVSRGFAKDAAGTGVTVNSVIAGPTHSAGVEDFVYHNPPPAQGSPGPRPPRQIPTDQLTLTHRCRRRLLR